MNHSNTLRLKIAAIIVLVFAFASFSYASEVIGTLSSNGNNNTQNNLPNETNGNGSETVSGSVTSPSNSGTQSGGGSRQSFGSTSSDGTVLGASTYNTPTNTYIAPSSTGNSRNSFENSGTDSEIAQLPPIEENADSGYLPSLRPAAPEDNGLGLGSWFWIILLSLVLLGIVGYFYSRPVEDMMQRV
jgi:hypothetical protein